jgi:hypothetical protein
LVLPSTPVVNDRTAESDLLSAIGWDLRALGEAQLRSLTSLQRCIEDFNKTGDADAAHGILRHAGEIEGRSPQVYEALRHLRETLAGIDETYR